MIKLQVFLMLAVTINMALCMSFRHKRQSIDETENNLDDRYGWDRTPQWQNQRPNQGRPAWSNQGGNQFPNQWELPNQGQFPGPGQLPNLPGQGQFPNQGQFPGQGQNTGGQNSQLNQGSTTESVTVQNCIQACPVTSEYNPVCGTNMVQYTNPGRLVCAQNCGVPVSLLRSSPCPVTTTAAPVI